MKRTIRRTLCALLAAAVLLALAPPAMALETYYLCSECRRQITKYEVVKEATCSEEGIYEYFCTNPDCTMYKTNQSQLQKVGYDLNNHDTNTATYRDNGNGTHSVYCTNHTPAVSIAEEQHTFNKNGMCTRCLAIDYRDVKIALPDSVEQFVSLHDSGARLTVGDASLIAGSADLTGEYTISYSWYYKNEQVGVGKSYALPADMLTEVGTYQYACFVMAVPKSSATQEILTKTCTVTVRVEDLITAYATVGSTDEYMDFSETNSRTPMSVEDQIYEAVYNITNGEPEYVIFKDPPASTLGTLDIRTDSRRYYFYSNNNRLSGVTFTPSGTGETGNYVIYFSAFDDKGKEFPGVLTIMVEKYTGNMDVLYTTAKGTAVSLDTTGFESFWLDSYPKGSLTRVNFTRLPSTEEGGLYIGYSAASRTGTRVKSGDYFYADPRGGQNGLEEVSFVPAAGYSGYVVVPFEAYGENNRGNKTPRSGNMCIFVSNGEVTDISCRMAAGSSYPFSEAEFLKAYQAAGGTGSSFYIQLLDVPASGALYVGYTGTRGTRLTAASIAERPFYYNSNWGDLIGDLTYVPGTVSTESVRYVAYDGQGRPICMGSIRFTVLAELVVKYESDGKSVAFQAKDFAELEGASGKVSSVTFTPPVAGYGSLYYGRDEKSNGTAITSDSPRYYITAPDGIANVLLVDKVSFLPAQGFTGVAPIAFTAYDEAGGRISGTVRITVTAPAQPQQPENPTNPTKPTDPADPGKPSDPVKPPVTFSDVQENESTSWYYQEVTELATAGVIGGYPDGTFQPTGVVTWAEALKMVMVAAGYAEQAPTGEHWASGYLTKAAADGLTDVKADRLDKRIDRYSIAEMAAKALKMPLPTGKESPFADMQMTDEAAMYVLSLYEAGILKGSNDKEGRLVYYGENAIQRHQMAVIIWRMYNYKATGNSEGAQD